MLQRRYTQASGLGPMRLIGGLLGRGVAKRVKDTLQPQRDCATVRLPAAAASPASSGSGFGIGEDFF